MKMICTILAVLLMMTGSAFAQDTAVDVDLTWLNEYILALVGMVTSIAVAVVTVLLKRKFGIDIEANDRQALQSALNNGTNLLLGRVLPDKIGFRVEVGNATVADAVEYVQKSVPDAIKRFGLSPADIQRMLEPKILGLIVPDAEKPKTIEASATVVAKP